MRTYIDKDPRTLTPWANNSKTHSPEQVQQIARSVSEFGFTKPVVIDEFDTVLAGHGARLAALELNLPSVPCVCVPRLTTEQKSAYVMADNRIAENAVWDNDMLRVELATLDDADFDLSLLGFSDREIDLLLQPVELPPSEPPPQPDAAAKAAPVTVEGDIWILGDHRVMCGDSTDIDAVGRLLEGETAQLLHADPPYGMGKQKDGVENDNLYREKLDDFQVEWWNTFRTFLSDNASAYIWGNAPDLWRLWYCGGLGDSERLELRNEIVWDKSEEGNPTLLACGKTFEAAHKFTDTERCLFFMLGQQFIGSINAEDYPEEYELVRGYLAAEAEAAGIGPKVIRELCDCQMFGHWFTKSQFTLIPEHHYATLAVAYPGRFSKPWAELKQQWDHLKGVGRGVINDQLGQSRSFFDSTHCTTTDVWKFNRVTGDDRNGHATPKPVEMMERVMRTSLTRGGLCLEPFGGSGSTLMGAERTGRRCYTMELTPGYVDVIVRRWQDYTGREAIHEDGETFATVEANS